jgi:DNA-binding response OmpR family regulator
MSLCASGKAGWRIKRAGRMHYSAQVRASPVLRFEHMSGPAAYGKLKFGPFELSIGERSLRREGVLLPLGGRALAILIYLAERPGEIITRQELIGHVWSDVIVQEGGLRVHVAAIRKALGDGQPATATSQTSRDRATRSSVRSSGLMMARTVGAIGTILKGGSLRDP